MPRTIHTTHTLEARARARASALAVSFPSGRFICGFDARGRARFSFHYHTEAAPRSYPSRAHAERDLARLYEAQPESV